MDGELEDDAAAAASGGASVNSILTDDSLRAILAKLETQGDRDNYSLVCKRWLMVQSSERRRLAARAGPLMLEKIAARFTSLVELDFTQSVSRSFYPGVIDADLEIIAKNFHNLERINLQECKGISDAGVGSLGKGIPKLRFLNVSGCKKVSDRGIEALAGSCSRLTTLRLARCKLVSDRSLQALSKNCKDLEQLDVSGCIAITDTGIQALARGCCKLQILDASKCSKLGDAGVTSIASSCPALKSITLLGCPKLSDDAIVSLARHCSCLEVLLLGDCRKLTDDSVKVLVEERGRKLKHLALDLCPELTDESIAAVFSCCDVLEKFDALGSKMTDASLEALRPWSESLREVRLNACASISGAGLARIAQRCPRLELLEVQHCFLVTQEAVEEAGFPATCNVVVTKYIVIVR